MNENGIQKSLEEQLEQLKAEQQQAEQIYKRRIEMGALTHDPASVQVLAQTILDRKMKIEELETQIAPKEQDIEDDYREEQSSNMREYQETSLTEYHRNPIINWLQKIVNKMEKFSEKLEQKRIMRENGRIVEPKVAKTKYEEYQDIIDTDFSTRKQGTQEKTAHQLFVEKISGNGAYHTYGKNAQSIESSRTIENLEKSDNNIQKEESYR